MSESTSVTEPERGPPIPAAELRKRILALLGSLQSLADLERENVERTFDFQLKRMQGMSEGYEYDGSTTEGWQYGISTTKLGRLEEPSTIIVGMDYGFDFEKDIPPSYCTLEFEPLAKELVAMGYTRTERMLRLKGNAWWGFRKENLDSRAVLGAMVYVYRIPDDESGRYCIKSISLGGDPLDG